MDGFIIDSVRVRTCLIILEDMHAWTHEEEHDCARPESYVNTGSDERVDHVGVLGLEGGDELAQREGGGEELVGEDGACERAGVVRAQPSEDLAPLVGVAVARGDRVLHDLLREG